MRGKIAPENACIYKAFPGRFRGGRYVFPSAPVFAEILSTSKQQDFGTFCPEVPAERRTYVYHIGKIRFIVTPVYKETGELMRDILLKLMLADLEPV